MAKTKLNDEQLGLVKRMVSQVWGYISADIPSEYTVADCIDTLYGTDYFSIHAQDKEAVELYRQMSIKDRKRVIRSIVA